MELRRAGIEPGKKLNCCLLSNSEKGKLGGKWGRKIYFD